MINGVHALIYAPDADNARAFFRDVLGLASVDAGHGWLIFALPPAELGIHPAPAASHELYLMCDDLDSTMKQLAAKGVKFGKIEQAGFGSVTHIEIPGGGKLGLYQPRHPTALGLPSSPQR